MASENSLGITAVRIWLVLFLMEQQIKHHQFPLNTSAFEYQSNIRQMVLIAHHKSV